MNSTEKTKHKWYDVVVAWANGEKIQCQWSDAAVPHWRDYEYSEVPAFNDDKYMWRIKPKVVTKKYRMALVNMYGGIVLKEPYVTAIDVTHSSIDDPAEYNTQGFICWVGDIVEVEVEIEA